MSNDKVRLCLECTAPLQRGVRSVTWTFRGMPLTYDQPAWWCSADPAHEYVMTREDMRVTAPLLKAHREQAMEPATPEEVTAIRERLHVSKRGAGEVLGAGANAFQKYEEGSVKPGQGMTLLLRLLKLHPELWSQLSGESRHQSATAAEAPAGKATGRVALQPDASRDLRP